MRASALYHVSERRVECREVALAAPEAGEVLIESRCSAVSPGTETMIFNGAFPKDAPLDAGIESLKGRFTYPFSYGYALVGKVAGVGLGVSKELIGRMLFAFHPHQDRAIVPLADCWQVPEGMPPEAALFLPPVETALNFVMDGAPLVGERVLVLGQGVVGLLTAALLAEFPLGRLVAAEPLAWRRDIARRWGIHETVDPADAAAWQAMLTSLNGADLAVRAVRQPCGAQSGDRGGRIRRPHRGGIVVRRQRRAARSRRPIPSQPAAPHFEPGEHGEPGARPPLGQAAPHGARVAHGAGARAAAADRAHLPACAVPAGVRSGERAARRGDAGDF